MNESFALLEDMKPLKQDIKHYVSKGWKSEAAHQFLSRMSDGWRHEEQTIYQKLEDLTAEIQLEKRNNQGFNPKDLIVSKKPHPTIDGIYEVEYKIPRKDMAGNITEPVSYKNIKQPKTIYDPAKISDEKR